MTYLYDSAAGARQGQIHALVIGVGTYRHLHGGSEPVDDAPDLPSPLTSPPVSAIAFAHWIRHTMKHPGAQLGSIKILLSPSHGVLPDGTAVHAEIPTAQAVKSAALEWKRRCDEDPRNVAVFYFCGHGLSANGHLLLLEDFGRSPDQMLEAAFDIDKFIAAMANCRARQLYLIDTCRERPRWLSRLNSPASMTILDVHMRKPTRTMLGDLRATSDWGAAYGLSGSVSVFTQALLDALHGLAAESQAGTWTVPFAKLAAVVCALCRERSKQFATEPQIPSGNWADTWDLHSFDTPPPLPLGVGCEPAEATPQALVAMIGPGSHAARPRLTLEEGMWRTVAPPGQYEVDVDFASSGYPAHPAHESVYFHPPGNLEHILDVSRRPTP